MTESGQPAYHSRTPVPVGRYVLLALLVLLQLKMVAQDSTGRYLRLNKSYLLSYVSDAAAVATAPLHWHEEQWIGFGVVGASTITAYAFDSEINAFFQRNRTTGGSRFSKNVLDPLGQYYMAGFIGGMYLVGLASGSRETETAALLTGKAMLLTGAYTLFFKALFQRERPNASVPADPHQWGGPLAGFHDYAFPSGHSSVMFAAAAVLGAYYHDKIWVGISMYSLASLVAVSRIYDNKHWASDVIAGSALGYAIGKLVYNRYAASKLQVAPLWGFTGSGIRLCYHF